jgi:hypothetical protein
VGKDRTNATIRAVLLTESFDAFWTSSSATWAGWCLDTWCTRAMRSRLEPMQRVATTLRRHRPLRLNWFAATGQIALGVVEGMNTNATLAIRNARGFRAYEVLDTALYHELGRLPEPVFAHRSREGVSGAIALFAHALAGARLAPEGAQQLLEIAVLGQQLPADLDEGVHLGP